jgi:molecular chaperone Hsp33
MTTSKSKITKYIENKAGVRATVVNATEAVSEMQKIQATYPIATMMVGRSMVAAALMAAQLKEDEVVSLYFRGNGPLEMVFAEANYEGGVRGYTTNPQLELELRDGRLDLTTAIGRGTLSVVRSNSANPTPYRGTVEIQTGEVGDDIAYYLQQSQQIRSVVSLGVKVNAFGKVQAAGGIIIELLPGAPDLVADLISARVNEAGSLSEALAGGAKNKDILDMYLHGFQCEELKHDYYLGYTCRCNSERLKRSLELLPLEDLDEIIAKGQPIQAKCEFCGRQYELPSTVAGEIRHRKFKNSLN